MRRRLFGVWTAGREAWWLGLYWAVFAVLCVGASRWAHTACLAEGLAGPCGPPAFYLGVVLAALPSAAVVAMAAGLALALRPLRRALGAPPPALPLPARAEPLDGAVSATGDAD